MEGANQVPSVCGPGDSNSVQPLPPIQPMADLGVRIEQAGGVPGMRSYTGAARLAEISAMNERSLALGGDAMVMLGNQRETLLSARETLESSAANVQRSDGLISQMTRRAYKTKAMMICLIIFLCAGCWVEPPFSESAAAAVLFSIFPNPCTSPCVSLHPSCSPHRLQPCHHLPGSRNNALGQRP